MLLLLLYTSTFRDMERLTFFKSYFLKLWKYIKIVCVEVFYIQFFQLGRIKNIIRMSKNSFFLPCWSSDMPLWTLYINQDSVLWMYFWYTATTCLSNNLNHRANGIHKSYTESEWKGKVVRQVLFWNPHMVTGNNLGHFWIASFKVEEEGAEKPLEGENTVKVGWVKVAQNTKGASPQCWRESAGSMLFDNSLDWSGLEKAARIKLLHLYGSQ